MKCFWLFFLIHFAAVGAWAQPDSQEAAAGQAAPDQRRAELRSVLKERGGRELQKKDQDKEKDKDQSLNKIPANRHLSAQEKADLRRQLRQQLLDVRVLDHP
jgi:hypothetical protein